MIDLEGFFAESPDTIFGVNAKLARLKSGELVWMRVSPNCFTYIMDGKVKEYARNSGKTLIVTKTREIFNTDEGEFVYYIEGDLWNEEEQKTDIIADE